MKYNVWGSVVESIYNNMGTRVRDSVLGKVRVDTETKVWINGCIHTVLPIWELLYEQHKTTTS